MLRKLLVLMIVVGSLAGFASYGSALFTNEKEVDANLFTAGTVELTTNPATAAFDFNNMAPGDKVFAPITVTNAGTLAMRYAVTSLATDADNKHLNGELVLTIKTGVTSCTDGGFGTDGTEIYSDILGATPIATKLIGDVAPGDDTGDRELPPTTLNSEILCFNVTLPSDSLDAFQGATTTATFTFAAEQTANNP